MLPGTQIPDKICAKVLVLIHPVSDYHRSVNKRDQSYNKQHELNGIMQNIRTKLIFLYQANNTNMPESQDLEAHEHGTLVTDRVIFEGINIHQDYDKQSDHDGRNGVV